MTVGGRVIVFKGTPQVMLANLAGLYAVIPGPYARRTTATRIHRLTAILAEGLKRAGVTLLTRTFFDTLHLDLGARAERVCPDALGPSRHTHWRCPPTY